MAEIERLIVELDAKVDGYIKAQEKAKKSNDDTGKSALAMGKSIAKAGAVAVTAITGVGAALSAMVVSAAKGRQELEFLAGQTKMNVDDFKSLTFATRQLGINAEQFADQSKDIADKLGEFAAAGTGAFQDFADVTGLTKEQAQEVAREFQDLSSDQVIGEMVERLDEAGASANEMTFVLESMGNDLSRLAPLFADNSSKLKEMQEQYDKVNETLELTQSQAQDLQEAAVSFDLMTSAMGNAKDQLSADLAPALSDFFSLVAEKTPEVFQGVRTLIQNVLAEFNGLVTTWSAGFDIMFGGASKELSEFTTEYKTELGGIISATEAVVDFLYQAFVELPANIGTGIKLAVVEITNFLTSVMEEIEIFSRKADRALASAVPDFLGGDEITSNLDAQIDALEKAKEARKEFHDQYVSDLLNARDQAIAAGDAVAENDKKNHEARIQALAIEREKKKEAADQPVSVNDESIGTGADFSKELEALQERLEAYEESSNSIIETLENRFKKEKELIEKSKLDEAEKRDALLILEQDYQKKLAASIGTGADFSKEIEALQDRLEAYEENSKSIIKTLESRFNKEKEIIENSKRAEEEKKKALLKLEQEYQEELAASIGTGAENIKDIQSVGNEIEKLQGTMKSLTDEQRRLDELTSSGGESLIEYSTQQQAINDQLKEQKERYIELGQQLKVLREEEEKRKLSDSVNKENEAPGNAITPEQTKGLEELQKRLEAYEENSNSIIEVLENKFNKEKELIENSKLAEAEKKDALLILEQEYQEKLSDLGQTKEDRMVEELEREVELHAEMLEKKLISEEQFQKLQAESAQKYMQGKAKDVENQDKSEKTLRDKATKDGINALDSLGKENEKFAKASFLVKQGQKLSEAVVSTAAGVTEALPNFPLAAAVGAAGALQIASIASTTFGSGSSGGSSSIAAAAPDTQADFQQDTFNQDVTVSDVGDIQSVSRQEITFKSDGGSPAEQLMVESLNEANRRGSLTVRG